MATIHTFFASQFGDAPDIVTSAPGRIEVLGNHTDYNGGTVVGGCIEKRLFVGITKRTDKTIRLTSSDPLSLDTPVVSSLSSYATDDLPDWTKYPLGILDELLMSTSLDAGFARAVHSEIPTGEGLSSSAAIELATCLALDAVFDLSLHLNQMIGLSHRAENRFVGVPCGLLDQTVVGRGKENALVVLDAGSGLHQVLPVGASFRLVVFRTHIRHELQHSPYEVRHRECRDALMSLERLIPGVRHLARLHPADISAYDIVLDETLARRARHVVEEQRRVGQFLKALNEADLRAAGSLLSASHESSKSLFENSTPEMDFLVAALSANEQVYGARLSGAGWGGAVLALVSDSFLDSDANRLADVYQATFDVRPKWWRTTLHEGARRESH